MLFEPEEAPRFDCLPPTLNDAGSGAVSSLHQLSPYIGKLKPTIAKWLIERFTKPGELVLDPFCGSGTIPLEAVLNGRRAIAGDNSPYACLLTSAKVKPPKSFDAAMSILESTWLHAQASPKPDLRRVPQWVRRFFDARTLSEVIVFADECVRTRQHFLLACLLGILHHQRPGFLSYPSSHLVPYLRDKKFPRAEFPDLYGYRELLPRMAAKICRVFKSVPVQPSGCGSVRLAHVRNLKVAEPIDALITSPPYMNALDYRRDNRLRLWLLDRTVANYSPEPEDKKAGFQRVVRDLVTKAQHTVRPGGRVVLVIGETVIRQRLRSHPSAEYVELFGSTGQFALVEAMQDSIPDVRRARRSYNATKTEHILVFEKRS